MQLVVVGRRAFVIIVVRIVAQNTQNHSWAADIGLSIPHWPTLRLVRDCTGGDRG